VEAALKLTRGLVSFLFVDSDELVQFSEKMACPTAG
jgi:excinuclease UvrABC ATPase subunit